MKSKLVYMVDFVRTNTAVTRLPFPWPRLICDLSFHHMRGGGNLIPYKIARPACNPLHASPKKNKTFIISRVYLV